MHVRPQKQYAEMMISLQYRSALLYFTWSKYFKQLTELHPETYCTCTPSCSTVDRLLLICGILLTHNHAYSSALVPGNCQVNHKQGSIIRVQLDITV